jgi:hypothetical protein
MAEDTRQEYKAVGPVQQRLFRGTVVRRLPRAVHFIPRPPRPELDYATLKATMASAVEEIKFEIQVQNQQTRADVQAVKCDVLAAIKESPSEYLKLVCEFGSLFLLFSLAIRFAFKIELVNPTFALFSLFAMFVYWAMAHVKEVSERRQNNKTQA